MQVADDTLTADAAYRAACEGTALLGGIGRRRRNCHQAAQTQAGQARMGQAKAGEARYRRKRGHWRTILIGAVVRPTRASDGRKLDRRPGGGAG